MSVVDRQEWDVVVVGAGGAGLRAAIEGPANEAPVRP
ncbi:succinate dehydrogenase/fumarate reductase flavoprotein subunit [Streptomyces ambofaciens]